MTPPPLLRAARLSLGISPERDTTKKIADAATVTAADVTPPALRVARDTDEAPDRRRILSN